jgi:hypothetical protein
MEFSFSFRGLRRGIKKGSCCLSLRNDTKHVAELSGDNKMEDGIFM